MFKRPSLFLRIAIGKSVGFVIGIIAYISMPWFWPEADLMFRLGILFWYTTFGAIIGVFGVLTYHPVLHLPMPWWFRAPFMGAWLNFVLALFISEKLTLVLQSFEWFESPFWIVAEGAVVGLLIGFLATRYGGEGKDTLED